MNEVDKRIAVEVMGEPRPSTRQVTPALQSGGGCSPEGGWWTTPSGVWLPRPFSSDIDQAMRAVDKARNGRPDNLGLTYLPDRTWKAGGLGALYAVSGETAPEAICNLLLALVDRERLEILNEITKESQELGLYDDD